MVELFYTYINNENSSGRFWEKKEANSSHNVGQAPGSIKSARISKTGNQQYLAAERWKKNNQIGGLRGHLWLLHPNSCQQEGNPAALFWGRFLAWTLASYKGEGFDETGDAEIVSS